MNTGYFLPIDAGGFRSFAQDGEGAGWYQLNMQGTTLDELPIAVPQGATGVWLQAIADLNYCFSPAAAADGIDYYMTLPAGSYMFFPGRDAILQLCILLGDSGTEFRIQFEVGATGPTSWVHIPGSGGGTPGPPGPPGPPGELSELVTQNVIHVMKNGDDDTGERNRLDLPFLTIGAALSVYEDGDLIQVWDGMYEIDEPLVVGNLNMHLISAQIVQVDDTEDAVFSAETSNTRIIITSEGDSWIASIGSSSVDSAVFRCLGDGIAIEVTARQVWNNAGRIAYATGLDCDIIIRAQVSVQGDRAGYAIEGYRLVDVVGDVTDTSTSASAFLVAESTALKLLGNTVGYMPPIDLAGGVIQVVGNLTGQTDSALTITNGGYGWIRGDLYTVPGGDGAVHAKDGAGLINIYGNIYGNGSVAIECGVNWSGTINVYGSVESLTEVTINIAAGVLNVYGDVSNIDTAAGTHAIVQSGGLVTVHGNVTASGGDAIRGHTGSTGRSVIHGNLYSALGRGITNDGSAIEVYGSIRANGDTPNSEGVFCLSGSVVVDGDVVAVGSSGARTNGGRVVIKGDASSTSSQGVDVYHGGEIDLYGVASSTTAAGARIYAGADGGGGILRIRGGAKSASLAAVVYGRGVGNVLEIYGGAYLETPDTNSIVGMYTGGTDTIRCYFPTANKVAAGTITVTGTLNVVA